MNDPHLQIIEKDGIPLFAVLPMEHYLEMTSVLNDLDAHAAIDQALIDDRNGETVPGEVVDAILDGVSPLRAWRECRELTLESLADKVGVTKGHLSQIENRRKQGSLELFRRISVVLNVTIDDLLDRTEDL